MTSEIYCADKIPSLSGQLEFSPIWGNARFLIQYIFPSPVWQCHFIHFYDFAYCDSRRKVLGNGASDADSRNTHIVSGGGASMQIRLSFFFTSIHPKSMHQKSENGCSLARASCLLLYCGTERRRTSIFSSPSLSLSLSFTLSFLFSC